MPHGKNKKNFSISIADEFIADITRHIPEKSSQLVRAITVGIPTGCGENGGNWRREVVPRNRRKKRKRDINPIFFFP